MTDDQKRAAVAGLPLNTDMDAPANLWRAMENIAARYQTSWSIASDLPDAHRAQVYFTAVLGLAHIISRPTLKESFREALLQLYDVKEGRR